MLWFAVEVTEWCKISLYIQSCAVCWKTKGWRWLLLLEVYHWLHKVFINRNVSWPAIHMQNHLDQLSLHKYWVNKLTSRLQHCKCWDFAEKERRNTIWTFWHLKQRDFWCSMSFWKREEGLLSDILHRQKKSKGKKMSLFYRPPDHCVAKQLMMVTKSPK